jgi:hypothetical protein
VVEPELAAGERLAAAMVRGAQAQLVEGKPGQPQQIKFFGLSDANLFDRVLTFNAQVHSCITDYEQQDARGRAADLKHMDNLLSMIDPSRVLDVGSRTWIATVLNMPKFPDVPPPVDGVPSRNWAQGWKAILPQLLRALVPTHDLEEALASVKCVLADNRAASQRMFVEFMAAFRTNAQILAQYLGAEEPVQKAELLLKVLPPQLAVRVRAGVMHAIKGHHLWESLTYDDQYLLVRALAAALVANKGTSDIKHFAGPWPEVDYTSRALTLMQLLCKVQPLTSDELDSILGPFKPGAEVLPMPYRLTKSKNAALVAAPARAVTFAPHPEWEYAPRGADDDGEDAYEPEPEPPADHADPAADAEGMVDELSEMYGMHPDDVADMVAAIHERMGRSTAADLADSEQEVTAAPAQFGRSGYSAAPSPGFRAHEREQRYRERDRWDPRRPASSGGRGGGSRFGNRSNGRGPGWRASPHSPRGGLTPVTPAPERFRSATQWASARAAEAERGQRALAERYRGSGPPASRS